MTGAGRGRPPRDAGSPDPRGGGIVALAGGVGAGRFLRGLVRAVDPAALTVVVNTADDVERHGLWVSPDIDSVVYALAGRADEERGWGLRDETWRCLEHLAGLGEDTWFRLGDGDLATHIWRSERRRRGQPLSVITAAQCGALGVACRVLPMSDDVVTSRLRCEGFARELHLQEWFVRERCAPSVLGVRFAGVERARPAPGALEAIASAAAVVVCPSNPIISIGPILAVPGLREALHAVPRTVAVTPIVAGAALRGPAAQFLAAQGVEVSAAGVAALYADFCQAMVVDRRDGEPVAARVRALGLEAIVAETVMDTVDAATALAEVVGGALGIGAAAA